MRPLAGSLARRASLSSASTEAAPGKFGRSLGMRPAGINFSRAFWSTESSLACTYFGWEWKFGELHLRVILEAFPVGLVKVNIGAAFGEDEFNSAFYANGDG